jgi:hypothetical protein
MVMLCQNGGVVKAYLVFSVTDTVFSPTYVQNSVRPTQSEMASAILSSSLLTVVPNHPNDMTWWQYIDQY